MKTARGALKKLPTHALLDLMEVGRAERCFRSSESVQYQPSISDSNRERSKVQRGDPEHFARYRRRGLLSDFWQWFKGLFRRRPARWTRDNSQQNDVSAPSTADLEQERHVGESLSAGKTRAKEQQQEAVVQTPTVRAANAVTDPSELEQPDQKQLQRIVRGMIGETILGTITFQFVADELARRGVSYRPPIERDTLVIRDCDLTGPKDGEYRTVRSGIERLIQSADYRRLRIETTSPVELTELLRKDDLEVESLVPVSLPGLCVKSVRAPSLKVKDRLSADTVDVAQLSSRVLEAVTVKATDVNVGDDLRATHIEVSHDLTIGGALDGVAHIQVVGRAVIGTLGTSISQDAKVAGASVTREILKKAATLSFKNGGTLSELLERSADARFVAAFSKLTGQSQPITADRLAEIAQTNSRTAQRWIEKHSPTLEQADEDLNEELQNEQIEPAALADYRTATEKQRSFPPRGSGRPGSQGNHVSKR